MQTGLWLVFLPGAYPLWRAWQANRKTSLCHAVGWMSAAWLSWALAALLATDSGSESYRLASHTALCFTGCAGVAVLGARRPGAAAWNLVVAGLLAVMLLPLAESIFIDKPLADPLRMVFLAATIAVGVGNFLPTCLAPAALLVGAGCAIHLLALSGTLDQEPALARWIPAAAPWAALLCWQLRPSPDSECDRIWLDFRDRFGFLWGQRTRDQFNRSAANAGWPVVLRWQGLRTIPGEPRPDPSVQADIEDTLKSLLSRFEKEPQRAQRT